MAIPMSKLMVRAMINPLFMGSTSCFSCTRSGIHQGRASAAQKLFQILCLVKGVLFSILLGDFHLSSKLSFLCVIGRKRPHVVSPGGLKTEVNVTGGLSVWGYFDESPFL
jgi:hypothetical protein